MRRLAAVLVALARPSVRHPGWVLAVAVVAAAASVAWAAGHLELRTSNLDLVDPELPPVARFRDFARAFGTPNLLVVVLEGDDEDALRRAVGRLQPRLAGVPGARSVLARLPVPVGVGGVAGLPAGLDPYFASRDRRLYFLFVQPDDPESRAETIAPFVEGVRRVLDESDLPASGVTAGLTGLPQYALDDRRAVERDLRLLTPVSFALVLALFAGAFRALRRPLAAMAALVVAVATVLGAAALWPGHLTLLSAFFGSILFGLGVDFGIHLVAGIEEEARDGRRGEGEAILAAVERLAPALATGALTTASAFVTLTVSGFRGFAELGWIAGTGVPVALVGTVTVLPALLVLVPPRRRPAKVPRRRADLERALPRDPGVDRIGSLLVRLQSPRLALLLALAVAAAPLAFRPGFDEDYLNLQPRGSEAVRWEREMVARSPYSPQFAAFVTGSREDAGALARRLRADATVAAVQWAGDLPFAPETVPSDSPLAPLAERFVTPAGRHAVYAYARGDAWDPEVRDRFLDRMAAADPAVTGMPVLGRFMIERSRRALRRAGLLASLVVFAWVLADLRDLRLALLALLPTALGVAALLALMALTGIAFNPLDVLALPVVIGIAVDDGVHLVHRYRAEGGDLERTLRGAGRSVVLTSATSLAAFGSLAFASHRGLASFALVLTFGVAAALATSVLVLPQALVRLVPAGGVTSPRPPRATSPSCANP